MANLLSMLALGANSLAAHRGAATVASQNLANASTPGYSRLQPVLESAAAGTGLGGVALAGALRARDRFVEAQLPLSLAAEARARALAQSLDALTALDPEAAQGLATAYGSFFGALTALSQNPGSAELRQAAVSSAQSLALSFRNTAGAMDAARAALEEAAAATVERANALAADLAELNGRIRAARGSGSEPHALLDARQRLHDQLAELVGARLVPTGGGDGDAVLVLEGGGVLVDGDQAATLSLAKRPGPAGGELALELTPAAGGAARTASAGGILGGQLDARDGALRDAAQAVDALAFELAEALNAAHRSGFGLDGAPGGDLFLAGADPDGAASRIEVSAEIAADPRRLATAGAPEAEPGDGAALARLIAVEGQALASGKTFAGALGTLTARFGAASQQARLSAENEEAIRHQLLGARAAVSGVSVDEELIALTQAQQAFAAVSKVILATQEMLAVLMELP